MQRWQCFAAFHRIVWDIFVFSVTRSTQFWNACDNKSTALVILISKKSDGIFMSQSLCQYQSAETLCAQLNLPQRKKNLYVWAHIFSAVVSLSTLYWKYLQMLFAILIGSCFHLNQCRVGFRMLHASANDEVLQYSSQRTLECLLRVKNLMTRFCESLKMIPASCWQSFNEFG